ncbi:MAG: HD domain-containing protein [Gemmatimonadales bacterium]
MSQHGYSDRIHHALAFCAKHHPGPVSRYDVHSPLLTTAHVAVILSRHSCDETTIVAGILKHLMDASPQTSLAQLHQAIACRFGGLVAATVDGAAEPRFDPVGRERAWKAARFEALGRLASASPRVAEIWMGSEIHHCGQALTDIRRLGAEYARSVSVAPPLELRWWHRSMLEVLEGRAADLHSTLMDELRGVTAEVGSLLADGRA